jgi:hypothetical protein
MNACSFDILSSQEPEPSQELGDILEGVGCKRKLENQSLEPPCKKVKHNDPNELETDEFQSSLSGFSFSFDEDSDDNGRLCALCEGEMVCESPLSMSAQGKVPTFWANVQN